MEHDPNHPPEPPPDLKYQDDQSGREPPGCGKIILWLIVGGVVVFLAAVAFVFGACLLS